MSRAYIGTNNFFDIKTRLDISKVIEEFISKNKKEEVNIINVGSPYLWEVADLSILTKRKINIIAIDLDSEPEDFNTTAVNFKSAKNIKGNWFDYTSDTKFDIIINRWFLHHLNTQQTKDFFNTAKNLLAPNGMILSVDYFFKKFNNHEERLKVGMEQNAYKKQFTSQPSAERWNQVINNCEEPDWVGGKMDCTENLEIWLKELGFESTVEYCSDSLSLDKPEVWGQKMIISKENL